jgi:protein kinase X
MNEKTIQKESNNNFIVQILDTFQDSVHLFIVQEFLDGGDLFSFIKNNGVFSI